jgi:hypothetical protein
MAAITHDLDRRWPPDRKLTDRHHEFVGVGERAVTDLDDQIVLQDSALCRRTLMSTDNALIESIVLAAGLPHEEISARVADVGPDIVFGLEAGSGCGDAKHLVEAGGL